MGNITRLDALDDEAIKGFQVEDCLVGAANVKSGWHKAKVQTFATRMHGPWPVVYGADGRQIITKRSSAQRKPSVETFAIF